MRRGVMRAQVSMSKRSMIAVLASLLLASAPLLVEAAQITPNPNPAGSTIDIINDPFAANNANPFVNAGTINIQSASTLTNSGTLINDIGGVLTNLGTLANTGTLTNAGTLTGFGKLGNTGTLTNGGLLIT